MSAETVTVNWRWVALAAFGVAGALYWRSEDREDATIAEIVRTQQEQALTTQNLVLVQQGLLKTVEQLDGDHEQLRAELRDAIDQFRVDAK